MPKLKTKQDLEEEKRRIIELHRVGLDKIALGQCLLRAARNKQLKYNEARKKIKKP